MKKVFAILSVCTVLPLTANAELTELWATGVSKDGGWSDFNKTIEERYDNNLCWAAAASNVIHWWQKQYKIPDGTPQGEEIWNTFKQSFTDDGSNPTQAFYWWFDGRYSRPGSNAAELKDGASLAGYYYSHGSDCIDGFLGQYGGICGFIIDSLEGGCGITLALSLGHEVTLWGIEYDPITRSIKKIWLTDSDDEQKGKNPEELFVVDCYEYKYPYSENESYLGLENYWAGGDGDIYVHMATALKPADFLERVSPTIPEPSAFGSLSGIGSLALVASRRSRRKENR